MRQVPNYLIIGNGRVARHFCHYLTLLGLPHHSWDRSQSIAQLSQATEHASHILLLISDNAINGFVQQHLQSTQAVLIHFSGSLVSENAYGAHPLMTFGNSLYTLEQYQQIPFILDHHAPDMSELLPALPNTHARLHTQMKAKYHALCVLSSNFSCMLWQKLFSSFETELGLDASIGHSLLQRQMQNILEHYPSALTGPLVRNDMETIAKNIQALDGDAFQAIYKSFVTGYQTIEGKQQ